MATFKIMVLGEYASGKTSFLRALQSLPFEKDTDSTVSETTHFMHQYEGQRYNVHAVEVPGLVDYQPVVEFYAREISSALLFFDLTKDITFLKQVRDDWLTVLEESVSSPMPRHRIVLVGGMADLQDQREILYNEGKQFAEELGMHYMEVSGKTNFNIKETMDLLISIMLPTNIPCNQLSTASVLGEGGFGVVYQGTWKGTKVAIKKVKTSINSENFRKEVSNAVSINHPNIVRSFGISEEGEVVMLVMELMDQSLHNLIHPKLTLTPQNFIQIALDVAEGLNYLHSLNPRVIHRDLKAGNILLTRTMRAKLSDFGTARVLNPNSVATTVAGTPNFMAPEVLGGEAYDEKADIYSLMVTHHDIFGTNVRDRFGVVLYEMITGIYLPLLFDESKRINKIKDGIKDKTLQKLVVSCCKTDPKKRPNIQHCIEVLTKLERKATKKS